MKEMIHGTMQIKTRLLPWPATYSHSVHTIRHSFAAYSDPQPTEESHFSPMDMKSAIVKMLPYNALGQSNILELPKEA